MLLSTCPSINTKCVLRSNTIFGCWGEAKSKRLKECFGVDFGNLTKQIYLFDPKINGVFFRIQLTPHLAVKHLVCSILLLLVHFNPKKAFRKTTVEVDKVEKVDRFGVDIQNLAQKIEFLDLAPPPRCSLVKMHQICDTRFCTNSRSNMLGTFSQILELFE